LHGPPAVDQQAHRDAIAAAAALEGALVRFRIAASKLGPAARLEQAAAAEAE